MLRATEYNVGPNTPLIISLFVIGKTKVPLGSLEVVGHFFENLVAIRSERASGEISRKQLIFNVERVFSDSMIS